MQCYPMQRTQSHDSVRWPWRGDLHEPREEQLLANARQAMRLESSREIRQPVPFAVCHRQQSSMGRIEMGRDLDSWIIAREPVNS